MVEIWRYFGNYGSTKLWSRFGGSKSEVFRSDLVGPNIMIFRTSPDQLSGGIFFGPTFWRNFFGPTFWRIFFGPTFWRKFLLDQLSGGIFLDQLSGGFFLDQLYGGNFLDQLSGGFCFCILVYGIVAKSFSPRTWDQWSFIGYSS